MARRIILDQGTSRLALWARRLALFALAAALLSITIVHSGLLEMRPALVTFGASLALAILALLLAFAGFVSIWREGLHGMGASLSAIGIAILLLAYPTFLAVKARNLPWIYDITTDPIDPPRYDTLAKARPRDANPIVYPGLAVAEMQLEAYPDIEPLDADIDTRSAYNAALTVINRRRWRVVEARPPDQGRPEGRIEAVARTAIMGFRDDIIVRVRSFEGGARVDARSSSRYGAFDFGANAARVRALLEDIEAEFANQAPDEPPPLARPKGPTKGAPKAPPKAPPKQPPKGNQANR
ncbi:MAG: DUF1499 domain-containing protein [Xanthobacteraceae bacterium]|nr:DUF1499 domain-containing protein [Xanthobacteraceae bacterium]